MSETSWAKESPASKDLEKKENEEIAKAQQKLYRASSTGIIMAALDIFDKTKKQKHMSA